MAKQVEDKRLHYSDEESDHEEFDDMEDEDYSVTEGSGSDSDSSCIIVENASDKLSELSIDDRQKSVDIGKNVKDEDDVKTIQSLIEAGKTEKLKVEQCKVYLRKNGLRLSGNKATLIERIKEHQQIMNGGGQKLYPACSFVLNCKGDACTGDVVTFEQNVYDDMYSIVSRSASGPPCGKRIVAGRIVKESYGSAKQQHTFTIEVLWSEGEKPFPPLCQLLIKGRNLYRYNTLRQKWDDEERRRKILMEKHSRGSLARSDRESRVQEKERKKMLRKNGALKSKRSDRRQTEVNIRPQHHHFGSSVNSGKAAMQNPVKLGEPSMHAPRSRVSIAHVAAEFTSTEPQQASNTHYYSQQDQHSNRNWTNGLPESTYHRQPFETVNHRYHTHLNPHQRQPSRKGNNYHPTDSVQVNGHPQKRKLCKYFAQGRCHFENNCRFSHELENFTWGVDRRR